MRALGKTRTLMGALLLCPGLAIAGAGSTQAEAQPAPARMAPVAPQPASIWQQVINAAAALPRYPAPQPGMGWPLRPQYPAPVAMQTAAPAMWAPFVWVLVPMPALPAPAEVDYGPVTHTPVIELPLPEATSAAATQEGPPVTGDGDAFATTPVTVMAEPAIAPVALSGREVAVDYGPVTPTPVVDLLALQPKVVAPPRKPAPAAPKPAPKSAAAKTPKASSKVANKPKPRLCWTNGVVAPCR